MSTASYRLLARRVNGWIEESQYVGVAKWFDNIGTAHRPARDTKNIHEVNHMVSSEKTQTHWPAFISIGRIARPDVRACCAKR